MASEIDLSSFIEQLRGELLKAIEAGKDSDLRFLVDKATVELEVSTSYKDEAKGELAFKVFGVGASLGGGGGSERSGTQKLTLALTPVDREGKRALVEAKGSDKEL